MVITGIGMLSSFANTPDELYTAIESGKYKGGCTPMPEIPKDRRLAFADNLIKKTYFAASKALFDSHIELTENYKESAGIFLGNSFGSLNSQIKFETFISRKEYKSAMPMDFVNTVMNSATGQLAILFGMEGMNMTVSTGSRAAVDALIYADDMIEDGRVCAAVIGGIEEECALYDEYIRQNAQKPSDGVCLFTVENKEDAQKRDAHIYAELSGKSVGYKPDFENKDILSVMKSAAAMAGISLSEIDFAITSGNVAENNVISELGISSIDIKSITGETYSASGAFAIAAAIAVMEKRELPNGKKIKKQPLALVNSFGFDGYMGCVVLRGI